MNVSNDWIGWYAAGRITSNSHPYKASWKSWTNGYATDLDTVSGPPVAEKKPERKRKNLMRLGVDPENAYAWSRTRKGGWRVAQSPILNTTITVARLKKRGYLSMVDYYQQSRLSFWTAVYENRLVYAELAEVYGGISTGLNRAVRGVLRQLRLAEPSTRLGTVSATLFGLSHNMWPFLIRAFGF